MKISYLILLFTLVCHLFSIKAGRSWSFSFEKGSEAKKVSLLLVFLILLSVLGEVTMCLFSNITKGYPFTDALLNYAFMLSSFILGYSIYSYNKKVLLWALYLFSAFNIALLLFYDSLPGFIRSLYGEYYVSGIRFRGTQANANTTMLVMNMLLLGVLILFKKKKLAISGIHIWLILIVPILTNIFVSSRGEFIHTILLEFFYIYLLVKNEKNKSKTISRIAIIVVLLIAIYFFIFNYLYYINDSVRYGIDRLMMIGEMTEVEEVETGDADSIMRPFFRANVFWARFKHSPLWGAGYSFGSAEDFIKSADGYHNDWFRVLASTGILGFACWFSIIKRYVKRSSVFVLLPFFLAGLSNTFLRSTHALNLYFFLFGVILHYFETEPKNTDR